jgi:hypothetical protein
MFDSKYRHSEQTKKLIGLKSKGRKNPNFIDLTGQRFGRLEVISLINRGSSPRWNCKCDCGSYTDVLANHLRQNRIKSCGCLKADWLIKHNDKQRKNKKSGTKEYIANKTLKNRYGITLADYKKQVVKQDNKCCLCKNESKLFVEHCHKTKKIRGLVCSTCNIKISVVEQYDSMALSGFLSKIRKYLEGSCEIN